MKFRSAIAPCIRDGFSLIEVLISLVILAAVVAALGEALSANRSQEGLAAAEDALFQDGNKAKQIITADLVTTGWLIPDGVTFGTQTALDPATGRLSVSSDVDRGQRYYPFVQQQRSDSASGNNDAPGSEFPHTNRTQDYSSLNLPAGLPGLQADWKKRYTPYPTVAPTASERLDYLKSFYARSQEILFTRILVRDWSARPDLKLSQEPQDGFAGKRSDWQLANNNTFLKVLRPSPWKVDNSSAEGYSLYSEYVDGDVKYGVLLRAGVLSSTGSDLEIRPQWEPSNSLVSPNKPITDLNDVREYAYCVIPSPKGIGLGRLVRAYVLPNPPASVVFGLNAGNKISESSGRALVICDEISDNVVRVLFETYRTDPDSRLGLNQIRVRIYLARRSLVNRDLIVRSVVDFTVTMRAKNNGYWRDSDELLAPRLSIFPY